MAEFAAIRHEIEVGVDPGRAFQLWTRELGSWWPTEYTFSGAELESIMIEPEPAGRCLERATGGEPIVWGRVLSIDPGSRLLFSWEITPDRELEANGPEAASEVEVAFEPLAAGTRVRFEHRCFENHGAGAAGYRDALADERGWPWLLELFSAAGSEG